MSEELITAEMALFSATEMLVRALRARGDSRSEAWAYISSLPVSDLTSEVRLTHFNLAWPEGMS